MANVNNHDSVGLLAYGYFFACGNYMWEKLLVPLVVVILYVILSGGFMFEVRENTSRMKVSSQAATIFVAAIVYSMAWHVELSSILGFSQAWILTTVLGAGGAVVFAIHQFRQTDRRSNSDQFLKRPKRYLQQSAGSGPSRILRHLDSALPHKPIGLLSHLLQDMTSLRGYKPCP